MPDQRHGKQEEPESLLDRIERIGTLPSYPGSVLQRVFEVTGGNGCRKGEEILATTEGYLELLKMSEMISVEKYGPQVIQQQGELASIAGIPVKLNNKIAMGRKVILVVPGGGFYVLL